MLARSKLSQEKAMIRARREIWSIYNQDIVSRQTMM